MIYVCIIFCILLFVWSSRLNYLEREGKRLILPCMATKQLRLHWPSPPNNCSLLEFASEALLGNFDGSDTVDINLGCFQLKYQESPPDSQGNEVGIYEVCIGQRSFIWYGNFHKFTIACIKVPSKFSFNAECNIVLPLKHTTLNFNVGSNTVLYIWQLRSLWITSITAHNLLI